MTQTARESSKRAVDERASGELREQFIAVLGHDLRNPLAAIAASASLLQRRVDPDLQPAVKRIQQSTKRMAGLIDDVLDFARGRLGAGLGVDVETVEDLDIALSDVVTELQASHPDSQLELRTEISESVRCDRLRIQQLLSNLLGNAISHGAANSPISVTATAKAGEFVLSVTNQGDPIPEASLDQVFGPFWRNTTGRHREGLGLGLYICSQIVQEHGGTIDVTSTAEAGTCFTARMPLKR